MLVEVLVVVAVAAVEFELELFGQESRCFFFETCEKTLGFAFQTEPRLRNLLFYSTLWSAAGGAE